MTPRRPRILQIAATTIAIAAIVVGVTLVVAGERSKQQDDQRFAVAQLTLRSSFGVFDDPAATAPLADDAVVDSSPSSPTPIEAVALLSIPKIGVEVAAVSYTDYDDLRVAVGYMTESDAPNEPGITYLVGHRTGFGAPFRELDQLKPGDEFTMKNAAGVTQRYKIEFVEIRKPTDALPEMLRLNGTTNVLLVTCHPEFSTELRLIVGARGA